MSSVCDFTVFNLVAFEGVEYDSCPVSVRLTYNADDPFAVGLTFFGSSPADWVIARDLLADGLIAPAGLGDVRIQPGDACGDIEIHLYPQSGEAVFLAPVEDLDEFLEATYDVCPAGCEATFYDVDGELAELFDMEGS